MKSKNIITTIIAGVTFLACACNNKNEEVLIWTEGNMYGDSLYMNPLFEPDLADPTFIRAADGWFYAYGTENTWGEGKHRVTPIIRSKNLNKWEYVRDAFDSKPTWHAEGGLWAPQIVLNNTDGYYYLYYSFSSWGDANPGIGVARSKTPEGPFEDLGKVLDSQSSGVDNSIDPFYIQVGSGRNKKDYLFWGSFRGIYGVELSNMTTPKMSTKFKIAGNAFEATYIYNYNDKFYFFGSCGSCCEGVDSKYRLAVAVADKITGPYISREGNDIVADHEEGTLFLAGDPNTGWVGPGHNAEIIVDDEGKYFMLYHAIKADNPFLPNGATRRPLMMDEVTWEDGWPKIEGDVPSNKIKKGPKFNN